MENICLLCRGSKLLCGKAYCPILVKSMINANIRIIPRDKEIFGTSPPSIFVGRIGYPKVYVGPGAPPYIGDTQIYDRPELWIGRPLEEILNYRFFMILGRTAVKVTDINNRIVNILQELAMAERPADIEMILKRSPIPRVRFDEYSPPRGPVAPLVKVLPSGNIKVNHKIERVYYDTDLKAKEAVVILYKEGVSVSQIQKVLSVGSMGIGKKRRLVPTRWSITAVDSIISENLLKEVRSFPIIDNYRVFVRKYMKNLFIAILAPRAWSYEWMEGWFPNTTWNAYGQKPSIEGDYEGFKGRTTYPDIGGCYYASRLATAEYLYRIRRQAMAILIREIYPGFILPIGVWFVRENIRAMFNQKPKVFHDIQGVINYLSKLTQIDFNVWLNKSVLLRRLIKEECIVRWLNRG